jgi:predicted esterase
MKALASLLAVTSLIGCRNEPIERPAPAPALAVSSAPHSSSATPPASLPPLEGVSWLEELPLADGSIAYVAPPVGAREPRPLIVAVHGAGDRANWACGGWRLAASGYAFVVCPTGLPMGAERFGWDRGRTIQERVSLALTAVHARFDRYIAKGPILYAGFSQGATLAEPALLAEPSRFGLVALAEGAYALLRDPAFSQRLHDAGTERLLIVCGTPACFQTARHVLPGIERQGLKAAIAGDPLAGHNLNQRMQDALQAAWPDFVRGLPNWAGYGT